MPRVIAASGEIERCLALLAETLPRIAAAVAGHDEEQLRRPPAGRGW